MSTHSHDEALVATFYWSLSSDRVYVGRINKVKHEISSFRLGL